MLKSNKARRFLFWFVYWLAVFSLMKIFNESFFQVKCILAGGLMVVDLGLATRQQSYLNISRWIEAMAALIFVYRGSDRFLWIVLAVVAVGFFLNLLRKRTLLTFAVLLTFSLLMMNYWGFHDFYPLHILRSWAAVLQLGFILICALLAGSQGIKFAAGYLVAAVLTSAVLSLIYGLSWNFLAGPDFSPFGVFVILLLPQFTEARRMFFLGALCGMAAVSLRFQGVYFSSLVCLAVADLVVRSFRHRFQLNSAEL